MPKILIVDDSETLRDDLRNALIGAGHEVLEGDNGLAGLEVLASNPDINLIVCDVNMPEMDGITMCEKVHEDDKINKIPIVMLTTEANQELKSKAKAYGVRAWVTKPFNADKLLTGIKKILG